MKHQLNCLSKLGTTYLGTIFFTTFYYVLFFNLETFLSTIVTVIIFSRKI
jgi:hypothetical protein